MQPGGAADDNAPDDTDQDVPDDQEGDEDDFDGEFDAERAKQTIRAQRESEHEARRSLKRERAERRKLEARVAELESSTNGDGDKIAKDLQAANDRATKAEARLRKQTLRSTAMEEAARLGFNSPITAAKLIDSDDVEWDDDEPTNVKSLLRDILRDDPSLKRRARDDADDGGSGSDAGAGRRGGTTGLQDMNAAIRAAAGR